MVPNTALPAADAGGATLRHPILVVDDDDSIRRYVALLLSTLGYTVHCSESGADALSRLAGPLSPAVLLLDLLMPGVSGLDVLDEVKRTRPALPVIVLSTVTQSKTVVDAIRRGAADYLTKPFQEQELELALQNVLQKNHEFKAGSGVVRRPLEETAVDIVSASPRLLRIKEISRQVADTDAPVLVLGESGVGKELVARSIHGYSQRRSQAFVKINCAALPQDLLESELFGYERGAFSGAVREKPGMFELADRGTILLDEIGEMSCHLQAKVLHVLQDGQYTRLGGRQPVKGDARVIASTNAQLEEAVAAGRFRADLYFRLNVVRIDVPPLRERREDIPLLLTHFLRTYAARYGGPLRELPPELREAFLRHDWPGNVRELENAVRRYTILPDVEMALTDLRRNGLRTAALPAPRVEAALSPREDVPSVEEGVSLRKVASRAAEEAERRVVRRVLGETKWNRKQAAGRLKISYKALLNKLKRWEAEETSNPRGNDEPLRKPAAGLGPHFRETEAGRSTV
jgi:two-component system response regulator AtoC